MRNPLQTFSFSGEILMSYQISLASQTALVTGADSGIGEGIAYSMALAGANIIVNYVHNQEAAHRVIKRILNEGGNAIAVQADVSNEDQVKAMFHKACSQYGTVDILVSNAGLQDDSPFSEMTLDQWQHVLHVNLTGGFLCAREAAREFLRRGPVPERSNATGKIIFISSVHQVIPWAGHANYAASKGGIMLLMKTVAQELAPQRIRVNAIAPGAIKTDINRSAWQTPEEAAKLCRLIPYDRIGEPGDIGPVAVWLASDAADYVTGTTLYVDGGMLLYPGFRTGG
jgi:glucose 1-dehydrogenase